MIKKSGERDKVRYIERTERYIATERLGRRILTHSDRYTKIQHT